MIGVVLWAAAVGNLQHDDAKVAIERLAQSSLWISQTILEEAYKALEEMYGFYLDD
jgi:predicted nucleic acid-binding protein